MTDNSELSEFERKQIENALEQVLSTDKFVAAPQMSAFLRYVVEQTALGNRSRIKAYTVAVDALGKPDSFDPQNDPVVRVLAGRLRSSLDGYYDANPQTNVVIQMRPGSYVPVFVNQQKASGTNGSPNETGQTADVANHAAAVEGTSRKQNSGIAFAAADNAPSGEESDVDNNSEVPAQAHLLTSDKAVSDDYKAAKQTKSGLFSAVRSMLRQTPKTAIAGGLLALVLFSSLLNRSLPDDEPQIKAATPFKSTLEDQASRRARPEQPSIFVSAMDEGNLLENQLNSMMSGVFSESENIRVYRILDSNLNYRFWPEDYIVSIEVLTLPTETRIEIQLMAAQTGRISHTDTLVLSSAAMESLTHAELELITEFSRNLVSKKGPLLTDYKITGKSGSVEQ